MIKKYNYISLFSSAGVGCFGFKQNDFDCIVTNELLDSRMDIQRANNKCKYEHGYIVGDITLEETKELINKEINFWEENEGLSSVDVVIATPPCQGMSTANYKKNNELVRNSLVVEAIHLINDIKPKVFVFENVSAFLKTYCVDKDEQSIKIGEAIIKNLGESYNIYSETINFKDYGVPSSRPRTLVVGTRKDLIYMSPLNIFPTQEEEITLEKAIADLEPLDFGEISENDIYHFFRRYPEYMREWITPLQEGQSAFSNEHHLIPYKIVDNERVPLKGAYLGNKFRRNYWDRVSPCIATRNDQLASQSTIHPSDDRVFSIRELMRLMTIPEEFKWVHNAIDNIQEYKEKISFLKKNELTIRRSIGEAVPTKIFYEISFNIKQMLDLDNYINGNVIESGSVDNNFYIQSYIYENNLSDKLQTGSFYTPQSVVFDNVVNLDFKDKESLNILEPSVGMGAFIPQLLRKIHNIKNVNIYMVDISSEVLLNLKRIMTLMRYKKGNIQFKFINGDFIKLEEDLFNEFNNKFDLIIGNPPFGKIDRDSVLEYRKITGSNELSNIFGFFMSKSIRLSDEIIMVMPKTFLMTPEYNNLREQYEIFNIVKITDYGVKYFKDVFIEIISIHFTKDKQSEIIIEDKVNNIKINSKQGYIYHDRLWIIYRNKFFDKYIKKLELDYFDFYRDRQITNKYLKDTGKIRVIKSKNITDNEGIVDIEEYDKYIDDISDFYVSKYLNEDLIIMPNFTYNTRAAILPKNSVTNGSVAILIPKNEMDIEYIDKSLYSTNEFREYYQIVKNRSRFTINIDSNSIYYIGAILVGGK